MKAKLYIGMMVVAILAACQPYNPPKSKTLVDSVFVTSRILFHGAYYPKVESGVWSIDLLSKGLEYDSLNRIHGTGWNLYVSDLFVPKGDTIIPTGIYYSDTTAQPLTFLPGMEIEPTITGCYLLHIQESSLDKIILLKKGQIQVSYQGDSIQLDMTLYGPDSTRYRGIYGK